MFAESAKRETTRYRSNCQSGIWIGLGVTAFDGNNAGVVDVVQFTAPHLSTLV